MSVATITVPTVTHTPGNAEDLREKISIRDLDFYYGDHRALKSISVPLYQGKVTAFIGPSGCGKSTLLRILNRMYDLYPNQRAIGHVRLDNEDILSPSQDLNLLRAKVGMVFQKPTPFPMTIFENIAFGIRLYERLPKSELEDRVKYALERAALWEEVKDKLGASGLSLSGGQQQRLCIARTVAVQPGGDIVRRAMLGPRPDINCQNRGTDRRAQGRLHDRDCDSQHAAGRPRIGFHGLHVSRRTCRIR